MSQHVIWSEPSVSKAERRAIRGHHSLVLWLTGLSGAGKSTIGKALERKLYETGHHTFLLDGDNLRKGINADLGFSPPDRQENVRRTAEIAKLFVESGTIVIAALISPFRADREWVRRQFAEDEFVEVFVDCPLEVCQSRDPKGLYQQARQGAIPQFTGLASPYEPPISPEIVLHTDRLSIDDCVTRIIQYMDDCGWL
ncbi:adenylyl-sulfate kinase [Alicyclobacillus contaminans]|uniref:adenylyl-sulfate kinase n=1 Tax=Alicyclobacillus contaminans TaxID=392016 RepID=UPI0003F74668|nr:adenylyl-sulfate kinase [Alicyclobacillus contaminans]GMA48835.1 adenylyl-sulfate kinase [Alicyclobacillus contaminans]